VKEFKLDELVTFKSQGISGNALIKGVAKENGPFGASYIIEPSPSIASDTYPFTHIVVMEDNLERVLPYTSDDVLQSKKL
jgi:hypothetical protein